MNFCQIDICCWPVLLLYCTPLLFCHPQYFNHFFHPCRQGVCLPVTETQASWSLSLQSSSAAVAPADTHSLCQNAEGWWSLHTHVAARNYIQIFLSKFAFSAKCCCSIWKPKTSEFFFCISFGGRMIIWYLIKKKGNFNSFQLSGPIFKKIHFQHNFCLSHSKMTS